MNLTKLSTEELGQEYAKLVLISEYEIDQFNEPIEKTYTELSQMTNLENEYRNRPDAESLDAFVECAIENANDYGANIK